MTLKARRILSLFFIIIFIVATPAIMLYAAGYRLGKSGFSIERTGMFIIDTKPRGARIFIDGREQKEAFASLLGKNNFITTPAKLKNILPGDHEVKVELNGYWSWQKKLTIYPGASTFAEDIYLFKNNLPALVSAGEIKSLAFSPDNNRALSVSGGRIGLISLTDGRESSLEQNGLAGKNIAWSDDGRQAVIDNFLYNLDDFKLTADLSAIARGGYDYKWSGGGLYWRDKNSLYRLRADRSAEKIIGGKTFSDFLVKNGKIYLINPLKSGTSLEIFSLADMNLEKSIALPEFAHYVFLSSGQNTLNIYDQNHEILYLINPFAAYDSPFTDIIQNIKTAAWLSQDSLLCANDFEIWLYQPSTEESVLITRISSPIEQVLMHPSGNYIIYSTAKTIKAIELDNREKRNITELLEFDSIGRLSLSSGGDILYFTGRIGEVTGLYKLLIQ